MKCLLEAINLLRDIEGEDRLKESRECYLLGFLFMRDELKMYKEAETILLEGLNIVISKYGENTIESAKIYKRLGFLYKRMNENEKSIMKFEKAREIYQLLKLDDEYLVLNNLLINFKDKEIVDNETITI